MFPVLPIIYFLYICICVRSTIVIRDIEMMMQQAILTTNYIISKFEISLIKDSCPFSRGLNLDS